MLLLPGKCTTQQAERLARSSGRLEQRMLLFIQSLYYRGHVLCLDIVWFEGKVNLYVFNFNCCGRCRWRAGFDIAFVVVAWRCCRWCCNAAAAASSLVASSGPPFVCCIEHPADNNSRIGLGSPLHSFQHFSGLKMMIYFMVVWIRPIGDLGSLEYWRRTKHSTQQHCHGHMPHPHITHNHNDVYFMVEISVL